MNSHESNSNDESHLVTNIDTDNLLENKALYTIESSKSSNIHTNFLMLNIPIQDFISSLPTLNKKQMKKLYILTSNKDIHTPSLITLTTEKDRNTRLLSTLSCLNRIKVFLLYAKKNSDYEEEIFQMYDEVFLHRCKDIDSSIRSSCYEYLCEFMLISDLFRKKEFFKQLINGLEDKNDSVRKKSVKGCAKIFDKYNKMQKIEQERKLRDYAAILKDNIYLMCQQESNTLIRCEAISLLIRFFKCKLCEKDDIMDILSKANEKEVYSLYSGLKDEHGIVNSLSEIYMYHPDSLNKLKINEEDRQEVLDFVKTHDECTIIHIDILVRIMCKDYDKICDIYIIFKKYKHMLSYIKKLILILHFIEPTLFTADDSEFIDFIILIMGENFDSELLENGFIFLKRVHIKYETKIDFFIENIKHKKHDLVIKYAIRNFDLSSIVSNEDILEVQVLSYLWQIKNNYFDEVNKYKLVINTKYDLNEASKFLIYCHEILVEHGCIDEVYEAAYDAFSALKILFDKLWILLKSYYDDLKINENEDDNEKEKENFNFRETLKRKKTQKNKIDCYITEQICRIAHIIFAFDFIFYCERQLVLDCIQRVKEINHIFIDSFFKYLMNKEYNITDIKTITQAIVKKAKKLCMGVWLDKLSEKKNLYDNCFIYFVKYLDKFECQLLFKKIKLNCKYKKMLEKRLKDAVILCDDVQEDVIIL